GVPGPARPAPGRRWGTGHVADRRTGARRPRHDVGDTPRPALAVRRGARLCGRPAAPSAAGGHRVTPTRRATGATLDTPLGRVIGDKTAKALPTHLDLDTVADLLYHFPRRYDERGQHTDIRSLRVGDQVTVLAQVRSTNFRPLRQRNSSLLEVTVSDDSGGTLGLAFFGPRQSWRERHLRPRRRGLC